MVETAYAPFVMSILRKMKRMSTGSVATSVLDGGTSTALNLRTAIPENYFSSA